MKIKEPEIWIRIIWATLGCLVGWVTGFLIASAHTKHEILSQRATDLDACKVLLDETGVELVRLERVIDGRLSCSVEECVDDFENWKKSQDYPCQLLQLDNRELRLALDRKCDVTDGELGDCKRNLRTLETQAERERARAEKCEEKMGRAE